MKPSEVKAAIKKCIAAKRPWFIWGPPGVGKSDIHRQLAEELGIGLRVEHVGQRDPVDVRGMMLPDMEKRTVYWTRPDFMPAGGEGILFLDELNVAPLLVQANCYQLIHGKRIGEHVLPEGWSVGGAGNRETDRAVTQRMSSALANRLIHISYDVDLAEWIVWALDHAVATEVIAFIRFRPELLHQFDPKKNEKAFATPRSWEILSDVLKTDGTIDLELASGVVGEGPATEFVAFLRIYRSLPDPDLVLLNPDMAEVPADPATLYAICGALSQKASEQNFGQVVKYANRLPEEYSVLLVRDAARKDKQVVLTRAFIAWASVHNDTLT